ncbi:branched-chain amino acid ABC transporter permease [Actinokineospora guangxiensis]|uniref:Branched-chain amino acid ABC transporter permease n=1 Tax=Actinokineospora guangxiensis TaxID=1490288 RepID=A0ABW0EP93_9PSEU
MSDTTTATATAVRAETPPAPVWQAPAAKPMLIAGGVLAIIAALLPWATFVLNSGAYPDKATLQFFDAPYLVTGFRLYTALMGIAVLAFVFAPLPGPKRSSRALGWGITGVAVINLLFISIEGGGLGAITAAEGTFAFGSLVALAAGALVLAATLPGPVEPVPTWSLKLPTGMVYGLLLVMFAGLLLLVAWTLTAGGQGGVSNPYAGAEFLSVLAVIAGTVGVVHATGLGKWMSALSDQHKVFSVVVLLIAALALPLTEAGNAYWMTTAANVGVYAATAIGLNIVVGLAGLLDIGYVAFLGIGAFVAANFSGAVAATAFDVELPFLVVVVIAAIVAGIFGAIVGSPTLRVRGDYLAIVTLAFGEIFKKAAQNDIGGLTGGANAIPGVPPINWFGLSFDESLTIGPLELPSGVLYYVLIVIMVALVMVVFANLKHARIGRAWIAIREDEDAARAMGIKTGQTKILAFLIGAMLAGVAGAVFAHKTSTVAYDSFQFLESVTLLAAVILGGMGSIPGAVLGASLLLVLPEKLREFSEYRLLLFGVALVLIMRFRPQGLVPDAHRKAELAKDSSDDATTAEGAR